MNRTTSPGDIPDRSWIDRIAPGPARPYLRLARLDRPIGTWLLLYPCWWGMALALGAAGGSGVDAWRVAWLAVLFAVGAVVMRGAGCVVNDILDRDFDARVARTSTRPIPSGQVSVAQALAYLAGLLALGLAILLQFNPPTIWLGVASLALVFPYPLMKRITWWPQLFLGLTFNWGALMGWTAITGAAEPSGAVLAPLALYAAGVVWTLGYDTIYAHQDKEDDARIGVRSTALRLGPASRAWVGGFYAATVAGLAAAGLLAELSPLFLAPLALAALQLAWQTARWGPDDPADCLAKFKSNKWFALLVLLALAAGSV